MDRTARPRATPARDSNGLESLGTDESQARKPKPKSTRLYPLRRKGTKGAEHALDPTNRCKPSRVVERRAFLTDPVSQSTRHSLNHRRHSVSVGQVSPDRRGELSTS